MAEGHVILIGGAEDKVRGRVILSRFVELAGGLDADITIVSSASSLGPMAGEMYRRVFTELGARSVRAIHATTRGQANDERSERLVGEATGVFLTGGNQLRLSTTIGGTRMARALLERHREGMVVAGTSAGASALSSHMMAYGSSGSVPRQRMFQMAAGLGILQGVVVDQHFQQRNRLGRLLAMISQNPPLLGVGIDEDTAGIIRPDGVLAVVGRRTVTIVDASDADTDAWDVGPRRPLMISNVVIHTLPEGYEFDLERRVRVSTPVLRAVEDGPAAATG
jgi:cyanophycinase